MSMFSLLPLTWRLVIIAGVLAAVAGALGVIHHEVYQSGYDAAIADVTHQNQEAIDAVNTGRARVRDCNLSGGMRWDQVARQCVPRT